MTAKDRGSTDYIHGQSPQEQARLSRLNDILNTSCLAEIKPAPGEKVLDVGSGLGQLTRLIARSVGARGQVVGVERDPAQLAPVNQSGEMVFDGLPAPRKLTLSRVHRQDQATHRQRMCRLLRMQALEQ